MDRVYYQLIEEATEATLLATAVVKNADYKECIKSTTDVVIIDTIKEVQRLKRTLQEVIKRQELASTQNQPA